MRRKLKMVLLSIIGILLISPSIVLPFIDIDCEFGISAAWEVLLLTIMRMVFISAGALCHTYVILSIMQQRQYEDTIEEEK